MHFPNGESILAGADPATLVAVQWWMCLLSGWGIGWVCYRLSGRLAALIAMVWWVVWPTPWAAAAHPYYYFWPIRLTVALAPLWTCRDGQTWWALPLLVTWPQFRMGGRLIDVRGDHARRGSAEP